MVTVRRDDDKERSTSTKGYSFQSALKRKEGYQTNPMISSKALSVLILVSTTGRIVPWPKSLDGMSTWHFQPWSVRLPHGGQD